MDGVIVLARDLNEMAHMLLSSRASVENQGMGAASLGVTTILDADEDEVIDQDDDDDVPHVSASEVRSSGSKPTSAQKRLKTSEETLQVQRDLLKLGQMQFAQSQNTQDALVGLMGIIAGKL